MAVVRERGVSDSVSCVPAVAPCPGSSACPGLSLTRLAECISSFPCCTCSPPAARCVCLLYALIVCCPRWVFAWLLLPSWQVGLTRHIERLLLLRSSNGCADLSVPSCMAHCRLMHPGSGGVICQSLFPLALHLPSLSCFQFHVPEETGLEMRMKYGFPS